jgi:hypothetical protein
MARKSLDGKVEAIGTASERLGERSRLGAEGRDECKNGVSGVDGKKHQYGTQMFDCIAWRRKSESKRDTQPYKFPTSVSLGTHTCKGLRKDSIAMHAVHCKMSSVCLLETQVVVTVEYFSLSLTSWRLILELVATAVAK